MLFLILHFYYSCKINPFCYSYILSDNSIVILFNSVPFDRSEEDQFCCLNTFNLLFSQSQHANMQIHQNIHTCLFSPYNCIIFVFGF